MTMKAEMEKTNGLEIFGGVLINVDRLLVAGFATPQDIAKRHLTLTFDNGVKIYIDVPEGTSLAPLIPDGSISG